MTSTALEPLKKAAMPAVYDRAGDVAGFIREIGDAIYKSRMFGCETAAQGHVLALECAAKRLPPLALAERYHLIQGKLSMKAEAMLADFHTQLGGAHKILERSPKRAAIEITLDGTTTTFELTWTEAMKEPFVYAGKESDVVTTLAAGKREKLQLKPKYATPRARMQMLWARVVSDAIRAFSPEVVAGHYTPEEVADFDGHNLDARPVETSDVAYMTLGGPATNAVPSPLPETPADDSPAAQEAEAQKQGLTTHLMTGQTAAATAEPQPVQKPAQQPAAAAGGNGNGKATAEQIAEVKQLVIELDVKRDNLVAMLARAEATKISDLSEPDCNHLLDVLRAEKARREGNS